MESKNSVSYHLACSLVRLGYVALALIASPLVAQTPTPAGTPEAGIASNVPFSVPDDLVGKTFVENWGTSGNESNVIGELRSLRYTAYLILAFVILITASFWVWVALNNIRP